MNANISNILQNGFQKHRNPLRPVSGIYFTDTATTACDYSDAITGNQYVLPLDEKPEMTISALLLCEVALGKIFETDEEWCHDYIALEKRAYTEMTETKCNSILVQGDHDIIASEQLGDALIATTMTPAKHHVAEHGSEYIIFNSEQVVVKYLVLLSSPFGIDPYL